TCCLTAVSGAAGTRDRLGTDSGTLQPPAFLQAIRQRLMAAPSAHAWDRAERPPTAENQSSCPTSSQIPYGPTIAIWPQCMGCEPVGPRRYFLQLERIWALSKSTGMYAGLHARDRRQGTKR